MTEIEDDKFVLIATTLLRMILLTTVLMMTPALQTWHARGMKHVGVLRSFCAYALQPRST